MLATFTPLVTRHNQADSVLTLERDLIVTMTDDGNTVVITVPAGFTTNLASVPKWLGSLYPRFGRYSYPAVVHDYLYSTGICKRSRCDKIFRLLMSANNCRFYTCWIFWLFVRLFGASRFGK